MKIKLVESIYFTAPSPRPEPQSCQMVLSALSSSPRVPLKEQWPFFPEAQAARGKGWWSKEARRAGAASGSGWVAGWWGCPGSCLLGAMKAGGRQPGKFTHSARNLFRGISERHNWAGADSYCFLLLPGRVGAREIWGRDAAFRGWR